MEDFIYIIVRGIAIGVLISAPMGPIGMLCIQRTLNKGQWPAFFTGVGAAFSDIFYCLLTGLGLSFVTDFIESHQILLKILGSLVIIAFGISLFKKNPARTLSKPTHQNNSLWVISQFLRVQLVGGSQSHILSTNSESALIYAQ